MTGTAAGVPFTALPPADNEAAPLVVTWHMLDAPRSDAAFAAALPMNGLPAWRVHLGMPMCGARMVDGSTAAVMELARKDVLMSYLYPFVRQAAEEFPAALASIRPVPPVPVPPLPGKRRSTRRRRRTLRCQEAKAPATLRGATSAGLHTPLLRRAAGGCAHTSPPEPVTCRTHPPNHPGWARSLAGKAQPRRRRARACRPSDQGVSHGSGGRGALRLIGKSLLAYGRGHGGGCLQGAGRPHPPAHPR